MSQVLGQCSQYNGLEITLKTSGDTEAIVDSLNEFGTSVVAINSGDLLKIHLHTDTPEPAVERARQYAEVLDVYRENMITQQYRMLADRKYAYDGYPGVAAVVSGGGMKEIFRELGTDVIVDGGATMNPSVKELVWAIDTLRKKSVILLPNNRDTFLTAREAARLAHCDVTIVESGSMVEGIASLMNFSPAASSEENLETMRDGIEAVVWGYVTRAERTTPTVEKGAFFAGKGKEIFTSGSLRDVAEDLLKRYVTDESMLISVYTGRDAAEEDTDVFRQVHARLFAGTDIDVMYGGQPNYLYLVSVE